MADISALFVSQYGPYYNKSNIDCWTIERDARIYSGPYPVIAHPPCERWGRYWFGGPSARVRRKKGDDKGCFASALTHVRNYDGVLEHPESSYAWEWFGLKKPPRSGGWIKADDFGGYTCCVAQGHYGHVAQKLTWLYAVNTKKPELKWGLCPGKLRLDDGFHSKEERAQAQKRGAMHRLSRLQRELTPKPFAKILIRMVSG